MIDGNRALVDAALAGQEKAQRALIALLQPVIERRVGYTLARCRPGRSRDIQQEKKDFTQEALLKLIGRDFAPLRKWDGTRLSLESFVALIAEREVISILRTQSKNPWTEDPTEAESMEHLDSEAAGPELQVASREQLQRLLTVFKKKLTDLGYYMFQLIYLEERSVEEVGEVTGMTPAAIFQWRSRLARDLPKMVEAFLSETGGKPRTGRGGRDASHEEP